MTAAEIEPVRKSIRVRAPLVLSFDVFTNGLARWWPPEHGIAKKPVEKMVLETRLGGRWIEISKDGAHTRRHDHAVGAAPSLHDDLAGERAVAPGRDDAVGGRRSFHSRRPRHDGRGSSAPQIRDDGRASRREDAQRCCRRLARSPGTFRARSRTQFVEPSARRKTNVPLHRPHHPRQPLWPLRARDARGEGRTLSRRARGARRTQGRAARCAPPVRPRAGARARRVRALRDAGHRALSRSRAAHSGADALGREGRRQHGPGDERERLVLFRA